MNQATAELLQKETQRYEEAVGKAWHYLYGDGSGDTDGRISGQGFATLAVAHATVIQALMTARH